MHAKYRGRTLGEAVGVVAPLAIVGAVVWVQAWHGPTLVTLSATHGIDTGDLIAVPFLLFAIAAARRRPARAGSQTSVLPLSAVSVGVLLLLTPMLVHEGGPLVPAGGATLDGAITQTMAHDAVDVGRWTNLALTYDGAVERLYINGEEVSRQPAGGRIQTARTHLWIGGNQPYGEHFGGLIDEVRAYDRALSANEIRRDMGEPVAPDPDLVAAYGFDAGAGTIAVDASGRHNVGTIEGGTTWAGGRYGSALRFDGSSGVVRVPASPSLDLGERMTLSAWIRPTAPQAGWRTVVQHEVDAYFLDAGSGRLERSGAVDTWRITPIVAAVGWFAFLIATARAPRTEIRRRTWWVPLLLFALGSLADAAISPTVTLFGPLLVAFWLAATATGRFRRLCLWATAAVLAGLTLGSIAELGEVRDLFVHLHGGTARAIALGALFVVAGVLARSSRAGTRMSAG